MSDDHKRGKCAVAPPPASLTSSLLQIEAAIIAGEYGGQAALEKIVAAIACAGSVTGAMIALPRDGMLVPCASAGEAPAAGAPLSAGTELYRVCIDEARTICCHDVAADKRINTDSVHFASAVVVPLRFHGSVIGVLAAFSGVARGVGQEQILGLGIAATLCGTILGAFPQESILPPTETAVRERPATTVRAETRSPAPAVVTVAADKPAAAPPVVIRAVPAVRTPVAMRDKSAAPNHGFSRPVAVAAVILLFCGALFGSIRLLRGSRGSAPRTSTSARASAPQHESFATVGEIGSPALWEKRTNSTPEKISGGRVIQRPAPVFPAIALQSRMRGTVKALVFVNGRGTVSHVQVTEGPTLLADATVSALSQWRFAPFFVEGNASGVGVQVPVTIEFEPSTAALAR